MANLQQYRQALASSRDMGGYVPITATSTSVSSTKEKEIICSALIDDTPNVSSRYANAWVYGTTDGTQDGLAGLQRQFRPMPLVASTGTLYVTRAFATEPLSGSAWEIYWRIPAIREDTIGRDGYRELINQALKLMVVPDRINVTGVTSQTKYTLDLSTHPWLRESGRIVNVWRPTPNSTDLERIDPQSWRLIPDGETLILQLPATYATGDTFKLEVKRPANSRLKQSGTWQDQSSLSAGLSADTDEAIPSINDVVAVARELCFWEMVKNTPESEARFWTSRAETAAREASLLKFARQEPTEPHRPMITGGFNMGAFR